MLGQINNVEYNSNQNISPHAVHNDIKLEHFNYGIATFIFGVALVNIIVRLRFVVLILCGIQTHEHTLICHSKTCHPLIHIIHSLLISLHLIL